MKNKPGTCFTSLMIVVLIFVSCPGFVCAQDEGKEYRLNQGFFKNFEHDFVSVCTSFNRWQRKDLWTFAAVLGTGVILYSVDQDINQWFQEQQSAPSEKTARYVSTFGQGTFLSALSAALYLSGELFDDRGLRKTGLLSLESFGTASLIILSLKFITGRARPQSGKSPDTFRPFSLTANFSSFPSGHSGGAWAVAAVVANESNSAVVDALAYSLASLVALSRVHNNRHWASDVFIGSAIGYFIGKKISSRHKRPKEGTQKLGLRWDFSPQGITLSYSF